MGHAKPATAMVEGLKMKALFKALADASASIPALAEDGRAEYGGGGYDYISAPGAIRTIKPALLEVGLLPAVTGTTVSEVCGKLVVELHCRLVHLESGELLEDRFSMPISPGRGRPEDKACQASITSGLGRWLRCLLLAVQAGEAEVDTSPAASGMSEAALRAVRIKSIPVTDAIQKERAFRSIDEDDLEDLARKIGVSVDEAASWGTRVKVTGGDGKERSSGQLGTLEAARRKGLVGEAVGRLIEDISRAESKGLSPEDFGRKVVGPWAKDQIPF